MGKLQLLILVHTAQLLVKNIVARCQHCMQTRTLYADQRKFFFFSYSSEPNQGKALPLPWVWDTGVFDMAVPMTSYIHSLRNLSYLAHSFLGSPYLVSIAIFQMLSWLFRCGDLWPMIWECCKLHPYKINLIKSYCVLTASPAGCFLLLFLRYPFPQGTIKTEIRSRNPEVASRCSVQEEMYIFSFKSKARHEEAWWGNIAIAETGQIHTVRISEDTISESQRNRLEGKEKWDSSSYTSGAKQPDCWGGESQWTRKTPP